MPKKLENSSGVVSRCVKFFVIVCCIFLNSTEYTVMAYVNLSTSVYIRKKLHFLRSQFNYLLMGLRSLGAWRGFSHDTCFQVLGGWWAHYRNFPVYIFRIQIRPGLLKLILRESFARQECDPELKAGEPLLQDVILYGRELTQDDLFDENEKEKITRDMTQLLEHYDHLRNFIDDEQERFVISIIIYIRLFNSDLFLFLVISKKAAMQRDEVTTLVLVFCSLEHNASKEYIPEFGNKVNRAYPLTTLKPVCREKHFSKKFKRRLIVEVFISPDKKGLGSLTLAKIKTLGQKTEKHKNLPEKL